MDTATDLMNDVFHSFLSAYHQNPGSAASNVIAFEAIGFAPGLVASAPDCAPRAVEYVSGLADSLPNISAGVYERTLRTISGTYLEMLSVSEPTTADATVTFNALKAAAQEAFENSKLGSINGPTTFKPAYASPANWYDPSQQTNWSQYSYSTETPSPPPPPPPQTPVGGPLIRPQIRLVAPVTPWRLTIASAVSAPAPVAVAPQPVQERAVMLSAARVAPAVQAPVSRPPMNVRVLQNERWLPPTPVPPAPSPAPPPAPPPVLKPQFSMSFDYCIVELSRPWFSGDFVSNPGWFVPGKHQGYFSSTPLSAAGVSASGTVSTAPSTPPATGTQPASASPQADPGATQPASPGPFSVIPTAFIAIKSLLINTTAIEGNSQAVTAYGPFSLAHASSSTDTLSDAGIQIIAWICSTQPVLPPDTDPALVPPSPVQESAGTNTAGASGADGTAGATGTAGTTGTTAADGTAGTTGTTGAGATGTTGQ